MIRAVFLCALMLAAPAAVAQVFDVSLGKTKLGVLTLAERGQTTTLQAVLTQTPLKVFDGNFTAETTVQGNGHAYESISISSRKTRQIKVRFAGAVAAETLISPDAEMTALSDPTRVPAGVIDPVRTMIALLGAPKCPAKVTFYDGRRVIALTPTETTRNGNTQTCAMSYQVIAGPGHLSPLKISKAKMALTYSGTPRVLSEITIGSGMFLVTLKRLP